MTKRPWQICNFAAIFVVIAVVGIFVGGDVPAPHAATQMLASWDQKNWTEKNWTETKWPFPMDQWGKGRAFRCAASSCGTELHVYVRPKIGFCNCTAGVADDEDMDRIADIELISPRYKSAGSGTPVDIANLKGRMRWFQAAGSQPGQKVLAVAFSKKCDVMVATAIAISGPETFPAGAVLGFLNGEIVTRWADRDLGV